MELRDVDLAERDGAGQARQERAVAGVGLDEQTTALLARWIDRRRRLGATGAPGAEHGAGGTPINVIRDDLGHTSLAVTDRYLRDVASQAVIDTLRARRWEGA